MSKNPYINPANPYDQLNESQERLNGSPEVMELSRLCYETFYCSNFGKKLIIKLNELFLMKEIPQIGMQDYSQECLRAESMRSVIRMLNTQIECHKQRIKAEVNKK